MKGITFRRAALFFVTAAAGLAIDLATKSWMFSHLGLPGGPTWWIWPEYVGFQTSLNQGALAGIGQGKVWLFASLSVVAAVAILYWLFVVGAARDRWMTTALAMVMAGVLGNLFDRLGLWWTEAAAGYPQYAVRDWILLQYRDLIWPNFNIADSLLVVGAGLLIVEAWLFPEPSAKTDAANSSPS